VRSPTSDVRLLALRAAWEQANEAVRRKWFDETVSPLFVRPSDAPPAQSADPHKAISRFLCECTRPRSDGRIQSARLCAEYNAWARKNGELKQTPAWFGRALRRLGLRSKISNVTWWLGIELVSLPPSEGPP
jgi:hypothetical protein